MNTRMLRSGAVVAALLAWFVVSAAARVHEETEESDKWEGVKIRSSIVVVLTVLVLLSILFEIVKEHIEEATDKELKPIVEHLWQELTVLGFLSVLSFLAVKSTVLNVISEALFDEEEELSELVEDVHMLLFAVMVVFIFEVLLLLALGTRIERQWERFEHRLLHSPAELAREYHAGHAERMSSMQRSLRNWLSLGVSDVQRNVEHAVMRSAFIAVDEESQQLPKKFSFCMYLSIALGESMGELIEISPWTWAALLVVFYASYAISYLDEVVVVIIYVCAGYVLAFLFALVYAKLGRIQMMLTPALPHLQLSGRPGEGSPLINEHKRDSSDADVGASSTVVSEGEFSHSRFPRPYKSKSLEHPSWIAHWVFGAHASNKHEQLFWAGGHGVHVLLACIRYIMILVAIYVSISVVSVITAFIEEDEYKWIMLGLLPVAAMPMLYIMAFAPSMMRRFTVVTSIEMLRKPEVQARVIRQQKTTQSLRILKLVHLMKFKSREKRCRKDIEGGRAQPRKAMSPHRRTELEEVFRLFDRDGSGSITANELVHLFAALGHPMSQEDAMDLVVELDVDKSGCLSFDEFQAYLEEEMMESEMSVEEQVDAMFSVFDVDRSGHITTDEFRAIVGRLGAQLSPEDVDGIIEEVDEDDSGTIDIHEFEELVKKHLK